MQPIKFRTLILIFCLLVISITSIIFALKPKPENFIISQGPLPSLPQTTDERVPFTVFENTAYLSSAEEKMSFTLSNWISHATSFDDWVLIKREDLGISFRVPPEYYDYNNGKIYENNVFLSMTSVNILTNYSYFPRDIQNPENPQTSYFVTASGLKVYVVKDTHVGADSAVAALELPYLSESRYLYFQFSMGNLSLVSSIMKSIEVLPPKIEKSTTYTNSEIGFRVKFPIPKTAGYNLEENFLPGSKGSFNVTIKGGIGLKGIGKDYQCECDAYFIQSFPQSSELFPVQILKNKYGSEYGVMTSNFRKEDDELGEALHVGEKIYIIKTNNKDFPVLTIRPGNPFEESIAKFIVDSFELIE